MIWRIACPPRAAGKSAHQAQRRTARRWPQILACFCGASDWRCIPTHFMTKAQGPGAGGFLPAAAAALVNQSACMCHGRPLPNLMQSRRIKCSTWQRIESSLQQHMFHAQHHHRSCKLHAPGVAFHSVTGTRSVRGHPACQVLQTRRLHSFHNCKTALVRGLHACAA
jgi:hypothetical protein